MKSIRRLLISEQGQWDYSRLKVRVPVMQVPILIASTLLSVSSLAAQPAPNITTSTPGITTTLEGAPKAATARIEAQASNPAQMKASHAILRQWHGSSYLGGEFSVTKIFGASHWRQFWQEYLKREEPADFDESQHQAVYIELGVRPTGGYAIKVVSAYEEGNRLVLEYIERAPTPDQYVTQALSTPWVMVLLQRTDLQVVILKASVTGQGDTKPKTQIIE